MSERQEWAAAVEYLVDLRNWTGRENWTDQTAQADYIAGVDKTIEALRVKLGEES